MTTAGEIAGLDKEGEGRELYDVQLELAVLHTTSCSEIRTKCKVCIIFVCSTHQSLIRPHTPHAPETPHLSPSIADTPRARQRPLTR